MEKKERSINELLQLLLNNINLFESGLCYLISDLYIKDIITISECAKLEYYVNINKPINFNTLLHCMKDGYFYWKRGSKEPRIKWLKKHIKKTFQNEK